ncbi:MAG: hypothetical protein JWN69_479 [Alphaproteobacteria bacterium]|nr:hypothetical protein [Alphaproteobacteria bacterium]
MRLIHALAAASLLATGAAAPAKPENPEAKLARLLDGRVPGKPVSCIDFHRVRSSQIIDHTAIVYDAGSTLYVNRPTAGLSSLDGWDYMVSTPSVSQICNVDIVHLVDKGTHIENGSISLGQFVPYQRANRRR